MWRCDERNNVVDSSVCVCAVSSMRCETLTRLTSVYTGKSSPEDGGNTSQGEKREGSVSGCASALVIDLCLPIWVLLLFDNSNMKYSIDYFIDMLIRIYTHFIASKATKPEKDENKIQLNQIKIRRRYIHI